MTAATTMTSTAPPPRRSSKEKDTREDGSRMVTMTKAPPSPPRTNLWNQDVACSLIVGAGSGALSSVVCAPLDLIRTRLQVWGELKSTPCSIAGGGARGGSGGGGGMATISSPNGHVTNVWRTLREITARDGLVGCFRGLNATLATVPVFWGLYFPLYEILKDELNSLHGQYIRHQASPTRRMVGSRTDPASNSHNSNNNDADDHRLPPIVHLTAAVMAGAAADVTCNPMFVVRTRMQTEALHHSPASASPPLTIARTIQALHAEGGLAIFWRGLSASLLGLSHVAVQFPIYEWLKAEARARSATHEESPLDLLLASGLSKMCASLLTYPHEVIRSRMMDTRGRQARSFAKTLQKIWLQEGVGGFYAGLHVSLLRVVPNCCVTFMTYEMLYRWTKQLMGRVGGNSEAK